MIVGAIVLLGLNSIFNFSAYEDGCTDLGSRSTRSVYMPITQNEEFLLRQGMINLLRIKDSHVRITTLKQCRDAVDRTIHAGGAFSAVIPLVSLFYGGVIEIDVENPTQRGQDMFVLSKGHAVATMATIYADLGYYNRSVLRNSRSLESILNGHPGPLLPGVHISTGPLGQGLSVAEGFALIGKRAPRFDVFCMTGDGELQEGTIWEAVQYSGYKRLDNLCVLIDSNRGQLDDTAQLIFPFVNLTEALESFGWRVFNVDATQYAPILEVLHKFKYGQRKGRPAAIICHTAKGFGGFTSYINRHKAVMDDDLIEQELALQKECLDRRTTEFAEFYHKQQDSSLCETLLESARDMNVEVILDVKKAKVTEIKPIHASTRTKQAAPRSKAIVYNADDLIKINMTKQYSATEVIRESMKAFAQDPRVVSIDSDLASTSGLQAGIGWVDIQRAHNVGVAEANMMSIGEAYAAMGYNTWVSTFCPFFDWRVLRRIAIGYQERLEVISADGWLSDGHGLDLTFVATAPNFETKTNGATHMGNDDITVFDGIAHLKIIDVSCPQQLLSIMKWIMTGNRGLVYLRIMRAPSEVLYGPYFEFAYGKGYLLTDAEKNMATIVSSGRGVHEALAAAEELRAGGIAVSVVDMPSIDEKLLLDLAINPKIVEAMVERLVTYYLEYNEKIFRRAKGNIDIFYMGDDFGIQKGMFISKQMWRHFFKPGFKKFIDQAHSHGIKVMHHTCGSVVDLIPEFIECGLDILQSLQPLARGMDFKRIKTEYGKYISFQGGIDIQNTMPFGTVARVKEEVKRTIETLGPGGGYILCTSHNLQPDTPIDNILAMYETAREVGKYPLGG